jgi:hypothetical protein
MIYLVSVTRMEKNLMLMNIQLAIHKALEILTLYRRNNSLNFHREVEVHGQKVILPSLWRDLILIDILQTFWH